MPMANVNGVPIAYEVIGEGRPWIITPGGRFSKDYPGVRELATAIAAAGNQVVIWDRPNTGASGISFAGTSESAMQADALAGLIRELDLGPTIIAGGSGGSRVSLLAATRHPELAAGLAIWWISGGIYGLMSLAVHYCGPSVEAAWHGGSTSWDPGRSLARSSEVCRVWCRSLWPLRKTSEGTWRPRASSSGTPGTSSAPVGQ
jgi:pimeloyl-ACP methyl ester carboxylesterase